MTTMTFDEMAALYCERQESSPAGLLAILQNQKTTYRPDGWMLLECQVMDGSRLGSLTILPYGPNNTFARVPDHPISPRGLASDMSVVVGVLPAENLPS
jgi:hypothetical protein